MLSFLGGKKGHLKRERAKQPKGLADQPAVAESVPGREKAGKKRGCGVVLILGAAGWPGGSQTQFGMKVT